MQLPQSGGAKAIRVAAPAAASRTRAAAWALNLDGADVEGEKVVDREEAEHDTLGVIVNAMQNVSARRRYAETILRPDIAVYVLGQAQADHSVGKPGRLGVERPRSPSGRSCRTILLWPAPPKKNCNRFSRSFSCRRSLRSRGCERKFRWFPDGRIG